MNPDRNDLRYEAAIVVGGLIGYAIIVAVIALIKILIPR